MSRIKDLKEKYPETALSMADIMQLIDPTEQNKYLGMLGNIFHSRVKDRTGTEANLKELRMFLQTYLPPAVVDTIPDNQVWMTYVMIDYMGGSSDLQTISKFIEMNERGVIENKDVQTYRTLDDLQHAIAAAELKVMDKEMATQIHRIFEDDEWLVIRPLTFESSCKYGAGTKWCTTAASEPQHFFRYWDRGALIYIINKQTSFKVAAQKYHDENDRSTLWNAADREINWADVDVPLNIFIAVKDEIYKKNTNRSLCSQEIIDRVEEVCLGKKKPQYITADMPTERFRIWADEPNNVRLDEALLNALRNTLGNDMAEAINNELADVYNGPVEPDPIQERVTVDDIEQLPVTNGRIAVNDIYQHFQQALIQRGM